MSYLDDEELEATRRLHGLIKDKKEEDKYEVKQDEANQKDTRLYRI